MLDVMCYCYWLRIEVLIHNICLLSSVTMAKGAPMKAATPKAMKALDPGLADKCAARTYWDCDHGWAAARYVGRRP